MNSFGHDFRRLYSLLAGCQARLTALGSDLKGVTEKTELIMLLEQPLAASDEFAVSSKFI